MLSPKSNKDFYRENSYLAVLLLLTKELSQLFDIAPFLFHFDGGFPFTPLISLRF